MQIGIIGINHKQAPVTLREEIASACQKIFPHNLIPGLDNSFIILSTCNRVEIYFSGTDLTDIHQNILAHLRTELIEDFDQKLYSFFGQDCFFHLAKVAAGLDSAIMGETEIKGQVANAYSTAKEKRMLSKELHFLFQKCLKIAKAIRTKLLSHTHMPGLEHAIFEQIDTHFMTKKPHILFIGASVINLRVLHYLLRRLPAQQITLANRTDEKADRIASDLNIRTLPWKCLSHEWTNYDLVLSAAKATEYILEPCNIQAQKEGKRLLIDLGVPRNIDPEISKFSAVTLLNIDSLIPTLENHKNSEQKTLLEATQMSQEEALRNYVFFEKKQYFSV
jgi:glutamyl-tRNA reductase